MGAVLYNWCVRDKWELYSITGALGINGELYSITGALGINGELYSITGALGINGSCTL